MPLGFHGLDLIVILVIALLIFGPKKLPEMGSAIGKSIKEFQKGMKELTVPKDEHEEEPKLPISDKDMSKLGTTSIEGEVNLESTRSEASPKEAHVD
jgi:sec-independent protein translocase protein TatA